MVMLGLALLPALSQALGRASGDNAVLGEICSPDGLLRPVAAAADGERKGERNGDRDGDRPAHSGHAWAHCPLCTQATAVLGLPPQGHAFAVPTARQRIDAPAQQGNAPALNEWASAQPRAPPVKG